ncbi:MAG: site-specific DNA-methyltransferase [Chloroflexi bacterium]|nr:site-specific DNA-methyltransferase [Chloroflexota bacterium]MCL5275433.1 site-specific DNA-methyltransferase [Chloroflexota bacterium]
MTKQSRDNVLAVSDIVKRSGVTQANAKWVVLQGDASKALTELPEQSFNTVITSPPYFWLRDYKVDNQIGLEPSVEGYVESICSVMDQVYRVLRNDGVLFLNMGDTYYSGKGESHGVDPKSKARRFGLRAVDKSGGLGIGLQPKTIIGIPWRVAIAMCQRRWVLRSPIIWHRKYSLRESVVDRPRRSYEYVFMFTKKRKYYFNRSPLINAEQEDMWTIIARPESTNGLHTAAFPKELVNRCLDIGCPPNGSVLDPFAGSGTTLRVALKSGRSATGIDINPEYCDYMVAHMRRL